MQNIKFGDQQERLVFMQVLELCQRYGYQAHLRFGYIFIYSKFESWRAEIRDNGYTKLFHGSSCGHAPQKYHYQFKGRLSVEELITYIHQHEVAKYTPQFVQFTVHPMSA